MDILRNVATFLVVWSAWSLLDLTLNYSPLPETLALVVACILFFPWKFVWQVMCVRVRSVATAAEDLTLHI